MVERNHWAHILLVDRTTTDTTTTIMTLWKERQQFLMKAENRAMVKAATEEKKRRGTSGARNEQTYANKKARQQRCLVPLRGAASSRSKRTNLFTSLMHYPLVIMGYV